MMCYSKSCTYNYTEFETEIVVELFNDVLLTACDKLNDKHYPSYKEIIGKYNF